MPLPSIVSALLSFLIPPRKSEQLLRRISESELRSLVRQSASQHETLLPYQDPRVKALVWELKFYRSRRALTLAASLMAERIAELCAEELEQPVLVPVPTHRTREKARGYHHTLELCEEIRARVPCSIAPILRKDKETPRQVELPRARRMENVHHTFSTAGTVPAFCLVIDDVTTTGATFEEATRALAEAGATRIICLALAS